jgi:AraC family transcriptional regulator of adaptative response/methylated-DNA-[protein]-cysteine methyltransferase
MSAAPNYERVEKAIQFLSSRVKEQPSLEDVAAHCHLSPFHFQRIFTEWAGISPKKFLQYLTVQELKRELRDDRSLLDAADRVGLSAQSRVYDHFVTIDAVTPREFATAGKGLDIVYGVHPTPFGECCIGLTSRGICSLSFAGEEGGGTPERLAREWAGARLRRSDRETKQVAQGLFAPAPGAGPLRLLVQGTKFQVKVWEALVRIPFGQVASYAQVAAAAGSPAAVRAVGSAVAANPIAYLIPCHRVIRSEGLVGSYHWGPERKAAMIGWEKARREGAAV